MSAFSQSQPSSSSSSPGGSISLPSVKKCDQCHKDETSLSSAKMILCNFCRKVSYCSVSCRKAHLKAHHNALFKLMDRWPKPAAQSSQIPVKKPVKPLAKRSKEIHVPASEA